MLQNGLILFQIEISNFHLKGPRFLKLNHCETLPILVTAMPGSPVLRVSNLWTTVS